MSLIVDTTIVSILLPQPVTRPLIALYEPVLRGHELNISFQTYAESLQGAEEAG